MEAEISSVAWCCCTGPRLAGNWLKRDASPGKQLAGEVCGVFKKQ